MGRHQEGTKGRDFGKAPRKTYVSMYHGLAGRQVKRAADAKEKMTKYGVTLGKFRNTVGR